MRKYECHTLYIVAIVILFSLITINNSIVSINSNNVSALSYQSSVGVGFTFNPTLSVSISPSDLVISNLTPGSTANSNSINVSIASNASYGYTLSAIVNGDNSDLTHTNNSINNGNSGNNSNNIFGSIATNADLSSLDDSEDTNIWGYSYKNNTIVSPSWSNYNGLSSSNSTTLINTNNNVSSNLDFKIAAKASNTQPSGTYTGVINFTAVSNVAPMSLLDSFIASGAEQLNGYFKMQDMTHDICSNADIEESELQLIDVRDNKIYWVAKLKDGNCWMTQNLDLDIVAGSANLTSDNTDLSTDESVYTNTNTIYALKGTGDTYGYTYENGTATWISERTTIAYNQLNSTNWQNSNTGPYSYDRLETAGANVGQPVHPDTNVSSEHGLAGNYYNWTAVVASNNSTNLASNPVNSICPKGWRLPTTTSEEFGNLLIEYNIIETNSSQTYIPNISSVNSMGMTPLYFIRSGDISNGALSFSGSYGAYWSSHPNGQYAFSLSYNTNYIYPQRSYSKAYGRPIRCLARLVDE